jgi:hypothetical protein
MIVSYRQRPEGKGKEISEALYTPSGYLRCRECHSEANRCGPSPGIPARAAAGSGFLQVCYSGEKG